MKTIYLVRHCEYDNPKKIIPGRLPVELSEEGRERALRLRDYFKDKKIERIYSSAVLRCRQTSEMMSDGKLPISFDVRLLEAFSAYQGYWFEREVDFSHYYLHRNELGGESLVEVQKRMVNFFEEMVKAKEERIIICSHGDPIYSLYLKLTKKPLIKESSQASEILDYPYKGSIIRVDYNKGKAKVHPALRV